MLFKEFLLSTVPLIKSPLLYILLHPTRSRDADSCIDDDQEL